LEQMKRVDAGVIFLRGKLNKMAIKLGIGHREVLRLSQRLDKLINIVQRRWQSTERIDE